MESTLSVLVLCQAYMALILLPTNIYSSDPHPIFNSRYNLDYGDRCNYSASKVISRVREALNDDSDPWGAYSNVITEFLKTDHNLCNSTMMLECDRDTERCKCGIPDIGLQINKQHNYIREEGQCKWATGSWCFGEDLSIKIFVCASNSNCTVTVDGNEVTCDSEYVRKSNITEAHELDCYCSGAGLSSMYHIAFAGLVVLNISLYIKNLANLL